MQSELMSACHAALSAIMCAAWRLGCSARIIAVLAAEKADSDSARTHGMMGKVAVS